ncbi:MAG: methyltransferase domain-containing protein [Bdellovibrionales bacterium]|nr:methyltransferase domain-containing protein [Bdellovibrionales bacterium]
MHYEIACIPGTSQIVREELIEKLANAKVLSHKRDSLLIGRRASIEDLLSLRTTPNIFLVLPFEISRPKALLGHEHMNRLITAAKQALPSDCQSFRVEAAGKDTEVIQRITSELQQALGLEYQAKTGDFVMRIRRGAQPTVWEVLFRISSRPLSVRSWRVKNFRGALDACLANCIVRTLKPQANETLCDLMVGSGTFLAEALSFGIPLHCIGVDLNPDTLMLAQANLGGTDVQLVHEDAQHTSFQDGQMDIIVANLPWGEALGSQSELQTLYQQTLLESSRLLSSKGRACFVTQRKEQFMEALEGIESLKLDSMLKVELGGSFSPYLFNIIK